ncbi:GNAT family N-acetyltransferase [Sphingomonas sp.]|uniref:GNAT family N-acetyltransferase n=1 Tax=Sphingomonas sp. TaxID=28214 RepID=UPI001B23C002|nr:GNAT family N-acetyltransferase [Sphingomonas sp.]MBO9714408.1 N-acetyltransferase [Sphingomonas sp.]
MIGISIRAAKSEDAAAIAAIYAPYVLTGTVSFEFEPPDAAAMQARMEASCGLFPWIVATNSEGVGVLGYAYATKFRERPAYRYVVETSVYVSGAAQGQGLSRLLYEALLTTLRTQGFTQAIAVISLPNESSIKAHEAVGFRRAGQLREIGFKEGRWVDIGMWQRELNDSAIPPVEPKPFSEVGVVRG